MCAAADLIILIIITLFFPTSGAKIERSLFLLLSFIFSTQRFIGAVKRRYRAYNSDGRKNSFVKLTHHLIKSRICLHHHVNLRVRVDREPVICNYLNILIRYREQRDVIIALLPNIDGETFSSDINIKKFTWVRAR